MPARLLVKVTTCPEYKATTCPLIKETRLGMCAPVCYPGETCFASEGAFGIYICNSNAIRDDSWDIKLNGNFIANYNIGNEYRALVILPTSAIGKSVAGLAGRGCTLFDFVYSSLLDTLEGSILMTMEIVAVNGFGNEGTVEFACTQQDATTVTLGSTLNSVAYSGEGLGYTLSFPLRKQ